MEQPRAWQVDAACRGLDPKMFFPESFDPAAYFAAARICAICPVAQECLDYAVAMNEKYGMWGGKIFGREKPIHDAFCGCGDCTAVPLFGGEAS